MSYAAEISRANPSCFVFCVDQSTSMNDQIGGEVAKRKADVVAQFGIVTKWVLAGPFDGPKATGYKATYPPEEKIWLSKK